MGAKYDPEANASVDGDLEKRFWEIDFFRGAAIVIMIVYHLFYDLNYFDVYNLDIDSGFWWYFARSIAAVFIILVGISLTLSYSRARKNKTEKELRVKYLKRGLKIFSWGLIITLVTWIFLRDGLILFGILHFIGVSIILAYPLIKHLYRNLLLAIFCISFGIYLGNFTFDFNWLMWLGLTPRHFYTVDYLPIFPWFGVILIGLFLGNLLYRNYKRRFGIRDLSDLSFTRLFCFLGRRSLFIYLVHQPVLVILLYFLGIADIGFL